MAFLMKINAEIAHAKASSREIVPLEVKMKEIEEKIDRAASNHEFKTWVLLSSDRFMVEKNTIKAICGILKSNGFKTSIDDCSCMCELEIRW